jgi:hypothetical protein
VRVVLEQLAGGDHPVELGWSTKKYSHALALPRAAGRGSSR